MSRMAMFFRPQGGGNGVNLANLELYMKLNNNIADSSTNAYVFDDTGVGVDPITYTNGLYSGVVNESGVFTAVLNAERIYRSDTSLFNFGNGTTDQDFSLGAIIKPNSNGSFRVIMTKGQWVSAESEWLLRIEDDNKLAFIIIDKSTSGYKFIKTTSTFTSGNTYNIDAVYESGALKIYSNGTLQTVTDLSAGTYVAMELTSSNPTIGLSGGGAIWQYTGNMDEVRVWSRALSAAEVSANHTILASGQSLL